MLDKPLGIGVLAFVFGLSSAARASQAQDPSLTTRNYDLAAVAQPVHASSFDARLAPLLGAFDGERETVELELESAADLAARVIASMFERELTATGCELRLEDGERLHVVAPAGVQRQIEAALDALAVQLRRAVELRIELIERPADAPVRGGVLALADADKLLAGGVAWSATVRAPSGRVGLVDASTLQRIVADYDVEVAEMAAQFVPQVFSLFSGQRWAVRAAQSAAGVRLALSLQSATLQELVQRELTLGGFLAGESGAHPNRSTVKVDLPNAQTFSGGFNLFIPAGKALVIDCASNLESGRERRAWVLRCSSPATDPAGSIALPGRPSVRLFDTSWIAAPAALIDGAGGGFAAVGDARALEWAHGGDRSLEASLRSTPLTELLARFEEPSSQMLSFGPFVLALGGDAASAPLALAGELGDRAPAALNFTWALRRRRGGESRVLVEGATALAVGQTSAWMHGAERRLVSDASVEIASRTGTIEPVVSSALDGLFLWARPARAGDSAFECQFAVSAHVLAGSLRRLAVGAPLSLEIDQGAWDVLTAQDHLRITKPGEVARALFAGGGGLELEITLALAQ